MSLRTAFSIAIMVALTGVAFSRARTTCETRIELGVHRTVVCGNTVGLRFKNKYSGHWEMARELCVDSCARNA